MNLLIFGTLLFYISALKIHKSHQSSDCKECTLTIIKNSLPFSPDKSDLRLTSATLAPLNSMSISTTTMPQPTDTQAYVPLITSSLTPVVFTQPTMSWTYTVKN